MLRCTCASRHSSSRACGASLSSSKPRGVSLRAQEHKAEDTRYAMHRRLLVVMCIASRTTDMLTSDRSLSPMCERDPGACRSGIYGTRVSVCSFHCRYSCDLCSKHLLGDQPELFSGHPRLTGTSVGGASSGLKRFFVLECETLFLRRRKEWTVGTFLRSCSVLVENSKIFAMATAGRKYRSTGPHCERTCAGRLLRVLVTFAYVIVYSRIYAPLLISLCVLPPPVPTRPSVRD